MIGLGPNSNQHQILVQVMFGLLIRWVRTHQYQSVLWRPMGVPWRGTVIIQRSIFDCLQTYYVHSECPVGCLRGGLLCAMFPALISLSQVILFDKPMLSTSPPPRKGTNFRQSYGFRGLNLGKENCFFLNWDVSLGWFDLQTSVLHIAENGSEELYLSVLVDNLCGEPWFLTKIQMTQHAQRWMRKNAWTPCNYDWWLFPSWMFAPNLLWECRAWSVGEENHHKSWAAECFAAQGSCWDKGACRTRRGNNKPQPTININNQPKIMTLKTTAAIIKLPLVLNNV